TREVKAVKTSLSVIVVEISKNFKENGSVNGPTSVGEAAEDVGQMLGYSAGQGIEGPARDDQHQ
ncbi:hypothetical protein SK128_001742, partial [Halocaridina rubra]